jgi:hypothetical protein
MEKQWQAEAGAVEALQLYSDDAQVQQHRHSDSDERMAMGRGHFGLQLEMRVDRTAWQRSPLDPPTHLMEQPHCSSKILSTCCHMTGMKQE